MLDRIGGEQARATSLVRYLPQTSFPEHQHPGGEEILVLEGQFSEGNRDYPAGWYLRNPPGSSHQPHSNKGTQLFVKLGQMTKRETVPLRIDSRAPENWREDGGMSICPLFESAEERVCLLRMDSGSLLVAPSLKGGAELLIVEGNLIEGNSIHAKGSWIRIPSGHGMAFIAGIDKPWCISKKAISMLSR
ncbi:TPA: cupin domain-containing protein [Klebsiella pneumoniae]|nr:cupin domain-containing protein [Klebsiella pneumoniae]